MYNIFQIIDDKNLYRTDYAFVELIILYEKLTVTKLFRRFHE